MFEKIKKIFKKKSKDKPLVLKNEKRTYEKKIDHSNDITFENEINKHYFYCELSHKIMMLFYCVSIISITIIILHLINI